MPCFAMNLGQRPQFAHRATSQACAARSPTDWGASNLVKSRFTRFRHALRSGLRTDASTPTASPRPTVADGGFTTREGVWVTTQFSAERAATGQSQRALFHAAATPTLGRAPRTSIGAAGRLDCFGRWFPGSAISPPQPPCSP